MYIHAHTHIYIYIYIYIYICVYAYTYAHKNIHKNYIIKVIFNYKHYRMIITAIVAITVMNNNRDFVYNLYAHTLSLPLFSFFLYLLLSYAKILNIYAAKVTIVITAIPTRKIIL
jgi:hypothetical protein